MNFSYPELPDSNPQTPPESTSQEALSNEVHNRELKQTPEEMPDGVIANIAHFISWAAVPVLMPIYGTLLIFHLSVLSLVGSRIAWVFTLIVAGVCTILPLIAGLALKKTGVIKDVALNDRKDRLYPYIVTGLCFVCTGIYFITRQAPLWCSMFYIGGGVAAFINALINLRWKISAHLAGVGGVVALLIIIALKGFPQQPMAYWIAGAIMCAGLIGSSRLYLHRHTLGQVAAGFAVGFLCVFIPSLLF